MNDLSPEEKALLELALREDEPSDFHRARVRRRLIAQLGVGAALMTSASSRASPAASAHAADSIVAKALLGASGHVVATTVAVTVIAVAAGAGGAMIYRSRHPAPRSSVASMSAQATQGLGSVPRNSPLPVVQRTSLEGVLSPPAPTHQAFVAPSANVHATVSPARSANGASPEATTRLARTLASTSPSQIEEEARLVRGGDAALRTGNPGFALSMLDEHARRFPNGVLAEERASERVLALCSLGREAEARADADRFLHDKPSTPQAAKVRASCGCPKTEER